MSVLGYQYLRGLAILGLSIVVWITEFENAPSLLNMLLFLLTCCILL